MANMMALNTVYNHYLTTYSRGSMTKYDTHKKSERATSIIPLSN